MKEELKIVIKNYYRVIVVIGLSEIIPSFVILSRNCNYVSGIIFVSYSKSRSWRGNHDRNSANSWLYSVTINVKWVWDTPVVPRFHRQYSFSPWSLIIELHRSRDTITYSPGSLRPSAIFSNSILEREI